MHILKPPPQPRTHPRMLQHLQAQIHMLNIILNIILTRELYNFLFHQFQMQLWARLSMKFWEW